MKVKILKREQRGDYRWFDVECEEGAAKLRKHFYYGGVHEKVSGKDSALIYGALRFCKEARRDLALALHGDLHVFDGVDDGADVALVLAVREAECA